MPASIHASSAAPPCVTGHHGGTMLPPTQISGARLGVHVGDVYRLDECGRIPTDRAFLLLRASSRVGSTTCCCSGAPSRPQGPLTMSSPLDAHLIALRYSADLKRVRRLFRVATGTAARTWRGLARTEVVWVFGAGEPVPALVELRGDGGPPPHPLRLGPFALIPQKIEGGTGVKGTVTVAQATSHDVVLPERVQEALGQLVGAAKGGTARAERGVLLEIQTAVRPM